jgi:hypothetical protein
MRRGMVDSPKESIDAEAAEAAGIAAAIARMPNATTKKPAGKRIRWTDVVAPTRIVVESKSRPCRCSTKRRCALQTECGPPDVVELRLRKKTDKPSRGPNTRRDRRLAQRTNQAFRSNSAHTLVGVSPRYGLAASRDAGPLFAGPRPPPSA